MIKRSAGGDQLWVYWVKLLSGGFRWWGRVWVPGGWFRRAAVWVVVLLLVVGCSGSRVSDRPVIPLSGSAEEDAGGVPSVVGEAGDVGVEPIRLGLVMASSGGLASLDSPVVEALRYAVRQVNESGGLLERPLELLEYDSNSELNVAYNAALRLLEREVSLIFVSCDLFYSRPVMEAAGDAGVLVVAPCGPEPRVGGVFVRPLAFSSGTSTGNYAVVMAEHAVAEGHLEATVFVESDDEWSVEACDLFSEHFAERGGRVAGRVVLDAAWWEVAANISRPMVLEMLAGVSQSPLLVLCAAPGGRGRELFHLLRASGVNSPVLATNALDGSEWLKTVPNVGSLAVVTEASMYGDDPSQQANSYFAGTLGAEPGTPERVGRSVTGAEGLWMFIRAVNLTGSLDTVALARTIEGFARVELWMGPATFSEESHIVEGRALRVVSHAGGASRLIAVRTPTETPRQTTAQPSTETEQSVSEVPQQSAEIEQQSS